jgi:hypothetical protein
MNFTPIGYIECGLAGSLGGWEPGDDTGRQLVSGEVAVFAADGTLQNQNPEEVEQPVIALPLLTWADLKGFLICGQIYE